jgi:hypothetical protein
MKPASQTNTGLRLSLLQLNHYFKQPVLNTHILTSQRLTDLLQDEKAKQKALEKIIATVCDLIHAEQAQAVVIESQKSFAKASAKQHLGGETTPGSDQESQPKQVRSRRT